MKNSPAFPLFVLLAFAGFCVLMHEAQRQAEPDNSDAEVGQ